MEKVCILLPALNEEKTIVKVLRDLPVEELKRKYDVEVVVGDSGSVNGTVKLAMQEGAKVISGGKGKGRNVRNCLSCIDSDYVAMLDSDGTYPATYLPSMLQELQRGYDVIYGSRLKGDIVRGAMSSLNKVGNYLLTAVARSLYKVETTDLCSGLWVFKTQALKRMELTANDFELEANIYCEVVRLGLRMTYIPIIYRSRSGTKPQLRALQDGWTILKWLIQQRVK